MKRYGTFEMVNGSIANGLMDRVEKLEKQNREMLDFIKYVNLTMRNKDIISGIDMSANIIEKIEKDNL